MSTKHSRVVLTVSGSKSDGSQLVGGAKLLAEALKAGQIESCDNWQFDREGLGRVGTGHYVLSCHRNTATLLAFLDLLVEKAEAEPETEFILVMAGGFAAALPGLTASYLYYHHHARAQNIFVVGVALADLGSYAESGGEIVLNGERTALQIFNALDDRQRHELAALLSISELPGSKLVINGDRQGPFFGERGFERACQLAVESAIPDSFRRAISEAKGKPPEYYDYVQVVGMFGKSPIA